MSIDEIERAVAKLGTGDLAKFRAWFEEFDAARFDEKIERDAKAGKLDKLAEQALADLHKGHAREL
jgi:4-alpha-glucanotransferase